MSSIHEHQGHLFVQRRKQHIWKIYLSLNRIFHSSFLCYLSNMYQLLRLYNLQWNIARTKIQALEKEVKAYSKPLSWYFLKGTGFSCGFPHEIPQFMIIGLWAKSTRRDVTIWKPPEPQFSMPPHHTKC